MILDIFTGSNIV